ncbi:MAG: AbrB/MazE/SpoVT family DNA-binding domain-containing protein [Spirochaetes bacterium]|nr:AbrB/MazE/SpoVT family DNA-binding domain-containing protein [Spirochaetota bacterium]
MAAVTVSPKFQVVIPREVREAARIKAGQKMDIIFFNGQIRIIPITRLGELKGRFRGIDTTIEREEDREL